MKRVVAFFKDKRVITVIGLIALSILIWFGGPYVRFGESNYAPLGSSEARLITIILILLIWGINNLRQQVKRNKSNDKLLEGIEESQSDATSLAPGQNTEEVAILRERFTQALGALKKLKFQGKYGKKVVYELPWYMIIGPPGSGKTTALVNSGLNFPLAEKVGKTALRGIGGTRNCDWWFTNEAVLIDTAGRYTTQDSHRVTDSAAWKGFIDLLKKYRPRRPINGVIIAISIQDILTQSEEERTTHARTIRQRVDELMEELGVRFPIYFVLTKADLISGFSEFFEDLGKSEREQVWGVTFNELTSAAPSVDIDWFAEEYNALISRLNDRMLSRVHQERDANRRGAIENFPQQMECLKPLLISFLKQTFAANRYHYQPFLRGVYITSGTQDGTSIDRMMSAMVANLGLQRTVALLPSDQGKSYFIQKLFYEIIFPEAELVGTNKRIEKITKWLQRTGYATLTIVVVVCAAVWTTSVTSNKLLLSDVEKKIKRFNQMPLRTVRGSYDVRRVLPPLNTLRVASKVYAQQDHPWLVNVGMYDPAVEKTAKSAYQKQLRVLLLPKILKQLEQAVKKLSRDPMKKGELYEVFRYYYMFKETQHMEPNRIVGWFKAKWDEGLAGQATKKSQLLDHLTVLLSQELPPETLDKRLVSTARTALATIPPARRIYSSVRSDATYSEPVDLLNLFGDITETGFRVKDTSTNDLRMPTLFTKDGYDRVDLDADSTTISSVLHDSWVLGERANTDYVKEDLEGISKDVRKFYITEYASRWRRALATLDVAKFKDLHHGVDNLAAFVDPVYSPLLNILQVTATNTRLTPQVSINIPGSTVSRGAAALGGGRYSSRGGAAVGNAAGALGSKFLSGNKVDKDFRELNALLKESGKRPARIESVLGLIESVRDYLYEISNSSDSNKAAFEAARKRFTERSVDAIKKLRTQAATMPAPMDRWLRTMAEETWNVILVAAKRHLNSVWRNQVYQKFKRGLAGRYPINIRTNDDLALYDFSEFFKPGGTIDGFVGEYLSPFIDIRNRWAPLRVDGRNMYFSPAALKQLRRSANIKGIFFQHDPESPSLTFQMRPVKLDESVAKFRLELGGQKISYSHGPKFWKKLSWPGPEDSNFVRVIFDGFGKARKVRDYEGPWAWFRLLQKSNVVKTKTSNVYSVTYRLGNQKAHFQIKAKSVNNPFKSRVISNFRCPETL